MASLEVALLDNLRRRGRDKSLIQTILLQWKIGKIEGMLLYGQCLEAQDGLVLAHNLQIPHKISLRRRGVAKLLADTRLSLNRWVANRLVANQCP